MSPHFYTQLFIDRTMDTSSLSLSLSHTHSHTHTFSLSLSLSLSFRPYRPSLSVGPLNISTVSIGRMNKSFCLSAITGVSMCRIPQENVAYEFLLLLLQCLARLTWMVMRWDVSGSKTTVCRVQLPEFVQHNMRYSCLIPIEHFSLKHR